MMVDAVMVDCTAKHPGEVGGSVAPPAAKGAIALFLSDLSGGGSKQRALTLADAFAANGYRVDIVVVRPEGQLRSKLPNRVRLVPLQFWLARLSVVRNTERRQLWANIPALVRYLRCERPDVLLATGNYVNFAAVWACRLARTGTRLVLRASNHLSQSAWNPNRKTRPLRPVFARLLYPWADAIIAVSEDVARDLARVTGIPRERIAVIPNPVVTGELEEKARSPLDHPWFRPDQPPVVLGVGRLVSQKDFPTLLRAFARLRVRRPIRLMILGEGKVRTQLASLAQQLGISENTSFPGYMDNPYPYMVRSAVCVLSSAWEGLPGVLIEAMACGCPVVSTDCPGGAAEILQGGVYGPLVPVGDDTALAMAIESVLDSPPEREHLQKRARYYSADRAVEQYLEILLPED
ncbi:MAG: glycosyltransferase [Kofleriaceae bacterium]|nr:glycosyltransferase [Candidatus Methylomirabilis lanthanidiphila]